MRKDTKKLLDEYLELVNQPGFIVDDPISIPHLFTQKKDIEIMGLFAATLAWGQRKTILANCHKLVELFEGKPHEFIMNHKPHDLQRFEGFVHRTFNSTDLLYFIHFLNWYYKKHDSLEAAFSKGVGKKDKTVQYGLNGFRQLFFSLENYPTRTHKHISSPIQKSACKRLNMYLRWMVRQDDKGVDFGIWQHINPAKLICPLDVHVSRTARQLKLITRKQDDWQTAIELTEVLRKFDHKDPVKYDFALYGMSLLGKASQRLPNFQ